MHSPSQATPPRLEPRANDSSARGVGFHAHEHTAIRTVSGHTGAFPIESAVKTLVFSANGRLILACCPAAARLSYADLARAAGTSRSALKPASEAELAQLGMVPGGAGPFSDATNVTLVLDADLADLPTLYCGSGNPSVTLELSQEQFRAACADATVASICAPPDRGGS